MDRIRSPARGAQRREANAKTAGQKRARADAGGARGGVGRSHHRGDAIRLAPAGVSATLGTIHLIAAGWLERLAADAYHVLTVHLSHVFLAPSCLVFGFLWSFLQSAGDGVLQALNEAIVHAKEPLERPSASVRLGSDCADAAVDRQTCHCSWPYGVPDGDDWTWIDSESLRPRAGN